MSQSRGEGCSLAGVGQEGDDPTAVSDLIALVEFGIVGRMGLPHLPEDLEPALPEAAQGAGMALAGGSFAFVVGVGPGADGAAEIGP